MRARTIAEREERLKEELGIMNPPSPERYGVTEEAGKVRRKRQEREIRYPWAMAPTINTTKLVATAIATFASTDKLIIFPAIMAAIPITPRF
jgi:hypothetical protein